jgi:hypothetical protein
LIKKQGLIGLRASAEIECFAPQYGRWEWAQAKGYSIRTPARIVGGSNNIGAESASRGFGSGVL